ncbi:MAG: O-antigen ligase family protein [Edaphocola sp.]
MLAKFNAERLILAGGAALLLVCVALAAYSGNLLLLGLPFALAILAWFVLNWKTFYWFFIFSIALSCEIHLGGSLSTTVPDEQFMWMFVPMVTLLAFYNYRRFPQWYFRHPITFVLFLQFCWTIVAVIYSQNLLLSSKFLAAKIWFMVGYVILPPLVFTQKKDFVIAFRAFAIPMMLHAVAAFCLHAYKKFNLYYSNIVVRPFYFNHVDHSTVLSMMLPPMAVAWQLCKGNKNLRRLTMAANIFLLAGIAVAGARAAMLAVIFCAVVAFAIRKKIVNVLMPAFYAFLIAVVFFLSHDAHFVKYRPEMRYTATQHNFSDLITAMFAGRDMSSMERFYRWIASLKMSTEHPMVGVGPNNFYDNYKAYTVPMFKTWVWRNSEKSTTHDYFLLMLVEQGWPAMLLYGLLLMVMFASAQRIYHKAKDPFYKKVTMGIIMMLAAGFVNNFFSELLETHKIGALFFIGLSLLVVVNHKVNEQNRQGGSTPTA